MDKLQALVFLRAHGLHAFERDWALGETIGVAAEPEPTELGITGYHRLEYLVHEAGGWIVDELDNRPRVRPRAEEVLTLADACARALDILGSAPSPRRT